MHDPRIGRFFAVDPLSGMYPYNSPYAFSENRVIDAIELEGMELKLTFNSKYASDQMKEALELYNSDGNFEELFETAQEICGTTWTDPQNNISWAEKSLKKGGEELSYLYVNQDATPVNFSGWNDKSGIEIGFIEESEPGV